MKRQTRMLLLALVGSVAAVVVLISAAEELKVTNKTGRDAFGGAE